ncbi:MAG: hypothetical protein ACRC5Q_02850 [Culicoidibacterales bacterium]
MYYKHYFYSSNSTPNFKVNIGVVESIEMVTFAPAIREQKTVDAIELSLLDQQPIAAEYSLVQPDYQLRIDDKDRSVNYAWYNIWVDSDILLLARRESQQTYKISGASAESLKVLLNGGV